MDVPHITFTTVIENDVLLPLLPLFPYKDHLNLSRTCKLLKSKTVEALKQIYNQQVNTYLKLIQDALDKEDKETLKTLSKVQKIIPKTNFRDVNIAFVEKILEIHEVIFNFTDLQIKRLNQNRNLPKHFLYRLNRKSFHHGNNDPIMGEFSNGREKMSILTTDEKVIYCQSLYDQCFFQCEQSNNFDAIISKFSRGLSHADYYISHRVNEYLITDKVKFAKHFIPIVMCSDLKKEIQVRTAIDSLPDSLPTSKPSFETIKLVLEALKDQKYYPFLLNALLKKDQGIYQILNDLFGKYSNLASKKSKNILQFLNFILEWFLVEKKYLCALDVCYSIKKFQSSHEEEMEKILNLNLQEKYHSTHLIRKLKLNFPAKNEPLSNLKKENSSFLEKENNFCFNGSKMSDRAIIQDCSNFTHADAFKTLKMIIDGINSMRDFKKITPHLAQYCQTILSKSNFEKNSLKLRDIILDKVCSTSSAETFLMVFVKELITLNKHQEALNMACGIESSKFKNAVDLILMDLLTKKISDKNKEEKVEIEDKDNSLSHKDKKTIKKSAFQDDVLFYKDEDTLKRVKSFMKIQDFSKALAMLNTLHFPELHGEQLLDIATNLGEKIPFLLRNEQLGIVNKLASLASPKIQEIFFDTLLSNSNVISDINLYLIISNRIPNRAKREEALRLLFIGQGLDRELIDGILNLGIEDPFVRLNTFQDFLGFN